MALFGKKKDEPVQPVSRPTTVNADDIWNTPVRKKETVSIKESKFDDTKTEAV